MIVLFDTSAIAKRYREENGREQVEHWLFNATQVVLAAHCKVEVASSLCRDLLSGDTSEADFANDMEKVEKDFVDFDVMAINPRIERLAIQAMKGNRLRAMDALHIATAWAAGVDLFVTADRAQARAAQSVALPTELVATA